MRTCVEELSLRRAALRSTLLQASGSADRAQVTPLEPAKLAAPFRIHCAPVLWERVRLGDSDLTVLLAGPAPSGNCAKIQRPAVILLHSTGKCKEYLVEHLERYARRGFLAAAYDARYHGERALPQAGIAETDSATPLTIASLGPTLVDKIILTEPQRKDVYHEAMVRAWRHGGERPFVFDTAADGIQVLDYLANRSDVDAARIGLVGNSLGGMEAWLLAAADERVAACAPAIGVQSFGFALERGVWGARVDSIRPVFEAAAKDLNKPEIDTSVVEAVWKRLVPGLAVADAAGAGAAAPFDSARTLPAIAPRHLLVVSGEDDPRCPLEGVRLAVAAAADAYAALGAPAGACRHFVEKGVGHEMTEVMWQEIDAFMLASLNPSTPTSKL